MWKPWALLVSFSALSFSASFSAAGFAGKLKDLRLDSAACYRVRDFHFNKEDLRFYLNDGYLIFSEPIDGRRYHAVFSAEVDGGDAELIVFPRARSERQSLANFTGTPNLNEHFTGAVFTFTDGTAEEMLPQLEEQSRKRPESAPLLKEKWEPVLRSLADSFQTRLVWDAASGTRRGMFYGVLSGAKLGTFDVVSDPRLPEQIMVGKLATRDQRTYLDVWASFPARSQGNQPAKQPEPDLQAGHFRIEAELDANLRMKVRTALDFTAQAGIERALAFDISRNMRITAVRTDGKPAEFFQRESLRSQALSSAFDNEVFLVIPPDPLTPGSRHTIEFEHEGEVISQAGNGVFFVGARGTWYPNRSSDFANYDLTFRYPRTLNLVATGELVEDKTEGEVRTTHRRTLSPIRFAGFNLGDYEKVAVQRGPVSVEVYANRRLERALQPVARPMIIAPPPPLARNRRTTPAEIAMTPPEPVPDPKARLRQLASEVASSLEFMSARFGPPPCKTLTVSPIPGAFGQGFPGLLYLSTLAYLDPRMIPAAKGHSSQLFFSDMLQAHETAHQWWGNLVTANAHDDLWLMEALSNYSALLYLEKSKGRKAVDTMLEEYRQHLLERNVDGTTVESTGPITRGVRLRSSLTPGAWQTITYEKGSWILHMLRTRMGDAKFLEMMGALSRRFRYRGLTTSTFETLAQEYMGEAKLDGFFEHWVHGTGIPALKLTYKVQPGAPGVRLSGSVQHAEAGEDFLLDVPLEVQFADRRVATYWVKGGSDPEAFTLNLKSRPVKVTVGAILQR